MQGDSQTEPRLFRPEEDIPALVALRAEIESIDQVGANVSEEVVRSQMKWQGHDPARDRWVVEGRTGKLLGHAWVFTQSSMRCVVSVAVHPACRRRGIGSALLDKALARAREHGDVQVTSGTEAASLPARAFLEAHRFRPAGYNRFFESPADVPIPKAEWPQGFSVCSFAAVRDLSVLVAACNRCYHDMWGHSENLEPTTVEFYRDMMERYPALFPPEGIFLVFEPGGQVVGLCFGRSDGDKVLDSPAVTPEWRDLPLLKPLVLETMGWLSRQKSGTYRLETWGDTDSAVETYRSLGFTLPPNNVFVEYLQI